MNKQNRNVLSRLLSMVLALAMVFACLVLPASAAASNSDGSYDDLYRRYYYSHLDSKEKKAYRAIVKKLGDMPDRIQIPGSLTDTQLTDVFTAVSYDNPEFFMLSHSCSVASSGGKYYFMPQYIMSRATYQSGKRQIDSIVNNVVSNAKKKSNTYQKELYVHDWIVNRANYTYNGELKYCVYGCLINRQCNCEGYARTYQLILNKLGIRNHLMTGYGFNVTGQQEQNGEGPHMWNVVTLNGNEYNCDLTWDDSDSGITFLFFNLPSGVSAAPSHAYFLRSTSVMKRNHKSDGNNEFVWNGAIDDSQNYFRHYKLFYSAYDSAAKKSMTNWFIKKAKKGSKSVEFMFSSQSVYNKAKRGLFDNHELIQLVKNANKSLPDGKKLNSSVTYSYDEAMYVIRVYLK
ncbi:MAG: hypothetical protein IIZ60_02925 [Clostridia bacterium]|nr:hypothetical protein [Clostridia bacterium]